MRTIEIFQIHTIFCENSIKKKKKKIGFCTIFRKKTRNGNIIKINMNIIRVVETI